MEQHYFDPETGVLGLPINIMPEGQGKRAVKRPRHDLIPLEFLDALADIFEEGLPKYGDSWKNGGMDFLIDCLNHASNHLFKFMNGDYSEDQLAKVAWNCLAVHYHIKYHQKYLEDFKNKSKKQNSK